VERRRLYKARWLAKNREAYLEKQRQWMRENKETFSAYQKRWRAENADRQAKTRSEWKKANAERIAEVNRQYAIEHRGEYAAHVRARQARKRRATPPWANLEKIKAFYVEAARLTAETGIVHHVDHIYPLKARNACGLHCEANLQILTGAENLAKRNKMPAEFAW
jgi:hypothetical protein